MLFSSSVCVRVGVECWLGVNGIACVWVPGMGLSLGRGSLGELWVIGERERRVREAYERLGMLMGDVCWSVCLVCEVFVLMSMILFGVICVCLC